MSEYENIEVFLDLFIYLHKKNIKYTQTRKTGQRQHIIKENSFISIRPTLIISFVQNYQTRWILNKTNVLSILSSSSQESLRWQLIYWLKGSVREFYTKLIAQQLALRVLRGGDKGLSVE